MESNDARDGGQQMSSALCDMPHPHQPVGYDEHETIRFKQNAIVRSLLDRCSKNGWGLNQISIAVQNGELPAADYVQLMQLIGYSVSGYGDLWMVPAEETERADAQAQAVIDGSGPVDEAERLRQRIERLRAWADRLLTANRALLQMEPTGSERLNNALDLIESALGGAS